MYSNKSKKYPFRSAVIFMWCICLASIACAQDSITLHIGDQAPAMRYAKWIKGTPVTSYEKDRLYVLEFWATWCGPCKAAMPHLSELAKKYQDKATFIGVNVWEKTGDKPYETSLPAVTKFVESIGNKMAYNVVADNNEQYMVNKWMKAAGLNGIPSTFLLKEGQIIWIGHPIKLDSIMELVIAGNFDVAAFKKSFEVQNTKSAEWSAKYSQVFNPIQEAIKAKDYTTAFSLIDKAIVENPNLAMSLQYMKFTTLLNNASEKDAISYAKDWVKQSEGVGSTVAAAITEKDSLSKSSYAYAAELFKQALASPDIATPIVNHYLAICYSKAGNMAGAIAAEEKAVAGAKIALKEGKWLGTIMDYTVTEYEEALAKYKKQQSKRN